MTKPSCLSDQAWATFYVLVGCGMVVLCSKFHWPDGNTLGAGIVGAGIQAFTKAEAKQQTTNVASVGTMTQTNESDSKK